MNKFKWTLLALLLLPLVAGCRDWIQVRVVGTPTPALPTPDLSATVDAAVKATVIVMAQTPVAQTPMATPSPTPTGVEAAPTSTPTPQPTSTSTSTPKTSGPTPTPPPIQAPGWEEVTVHTLCLEVEQSYPQIDEEFSMPIAEAAQRILAGVGLQVVDEGAPCDATLTVALIGRAQGAGYSGGSTCYTGAEYSGGVTLTVPNREPLTVSVSEYVPPSELTFHCPNPEGAPFRRTWSKALVDGLSRVWGLPFLIQTLGDEMAQVRWAAADKLGEIGPEVVPTLIQALQDDKWEKRRAAARALAEMGPAVREAVPALIQALGDEEANVRETVAWALGEMGSVANEAVPALIQLLGDEEGNVSYNAFRALKAITGHDFGEDQARWRQWWEENKVPTPTSTPMATPGATGRVEGRLPDASGVKVTLCDLVPTAWPGTAFECGGEFEQSVTIDAAGYFLFPAVPPGAYHILFDILEALEGVVPDFLCGPGDYHRRDPVSEGAREACFNEEDLGPTVMVKAGQTTVYHFQATATSDLPTVAPTPTPLPLPQPVIIGPVDAGGNAEVIIINDTPYELTVHFDGPHSQSLEVEACPICKVYSGVGPSSCQVAGRLQTAVQISPGDYEVSARVNAPGVVSFAGQWTLQGNNSYQSCFFIVTQ